MKSYFNAIVILFAIYCNASQKTVPNSDAASRTSTPTGQTPPNSSELMKVVEHTPEETRARREELRKQVKSQGPEKTLERYLNS